MTTSNDGTDEGRWARHPAMIRAEEYLIQQAEIWPTRTEFVAACTVYGVGETGHLITSATWTQGVQTLLPEVDYVSFGSIDLDRKVGTAYAFHVAWRDVLTIVGSRMTLADLSPARHVVDSFPSDEELIELCNRDQRLPVWPVLGIHTIRDRLKGIWDLPSERKTEVGRRRRL